MDQARNAMARTAAQIRTGHWRSAVYLRRIKKRREDKCWFCKGGAKMTRSHALLYCPNATLAAGVGGKESKWNSGTPLGPTVGEPAVEIPGIVRCRTVCGRGSG
jgi:hypothetical protein